MQSVLRRYSVPIWIGVWALVRLFGDFTPAAAGVFLLGVVVLMVVAERERHRLHELNKRRRHDDC